MRLSFPTLLLILAFAVPVSAAPDSKKLPQSDDAADIADKLADRVDLERMDKVPLREVLGMFQDKLGYTILIDYKPILESLGEDGTNNTLLDDKSITLPAMKRVRVETALRFVLDQLRADYYIAADHVRVTSPSIKQFVIGRTKTLRDIADQDPPDEQLDSPTVISRTPTVTVSFKDMPLAEALKMVSTRTGASLVLAGDAADKGRTIINLNLANASVDTTAIGLAEAAGLKAYRNGGLIVLVGKERAKQLDAPTGGSGGGCCSFSSGWTVKLDELEALSRLFPAARPEDAKSAQQKKELDELRDEAARLQAAKKELEDRVKTLNAELEKTQKKKQ